MRIQSATERGIQFFFTHTGTVDYSYRQFCPVPSGPPYDVTKPNEPFDGFPITLFFDLTEDVVYDNSESPYAVITARLTKVDE